DRGRQIAERPELDAGVSRLHDLVQEALPGCLPGVGWEPDAPRVRGGAELYHHDPSSRVTRSWTSLPEDHHQNRPRRERDWTCAPGGRNSFAARLPVGSLQAWRLPSSDLRSKAG